MILSEPQQRSSYLRHLQAQTSDYQPLTHSQFFLPENTTQQAAVLLGNDSRNIEFDDINIDLDIDAELNPHSLSSSPISTQSLLSHYSAPLSTLDSIPTIAIPRAPQDGVLFKFPAHPDQLALSNNSSPVFGHAEMMQTDSWLPSDQLTPKSAGRFVHQRESSLSSLGSAGPSSPYSHNTSNPQIAVTDSLAEGFHGLAGGQEDLNYQLSKFPANTQDAFYPNYPNYAPADTSVMPAVAYSSMVAQPRQRTAANLLAATDHSVGTSRSRPLSVASSINSDSPATPSAEPEDDRRRKNIFTNAVPKLDRTMTDVYNDELYSPNFSLGSASSMHLTASPKNDIFTQRLQAANNQHLSANHSPISATSRDKSPFRTSSPLAPMPVHDFSAGMNSNGLRFGSAQQLREQRKAVQDAQAVRQHLARNSGPSNPPTISPKDAMLDFTDADGSAAAMPLFPQQATVSTAQPTQQFDALVLDDATFSNYVTSQLPTGLQVPQQYPFISQPREQSSVSSLSNVSLSQSRLGSADVGSSGSSHTNSPQRPAVTSADGGTYTCTYHGCTMRFETPALLQKHKREGHRQAHGLGATRRPDGTPTAVAPGLFNSQAGPHRCDRVNPSTGKPCNTIFSRPYDLTRHEDTIHNARKQKVRCDLCTDEKTFSRADALTRHYRVCHPDVELQGKHRRRAHA